MRRVVLWVQFLLATTSRCSSGVGVDLGPKHLVDYKSAGQLQFCEWLVTIRSATDGTGGGQGWAVPTAQLQLAAGGNLKGDSGSLCRDTSKGCSAGICLLGGTACTAAGPAGCHVLCWTWQKIKHHCYAKLVWCFIPPFPQTRMPASVEFQ